MHRKNSRDLQPSSNPQWTEKFHYHKGRGRSSSASLQMLHVILIRQPNLAHWVKIRGCCTRHSCVSKMYSLVIIAGVAYHSDPRVVLGCSTQQRHTTCITNTLYGQHLLVHGTHCLWETASPDHQQWCNNQVKFHAEETWLQPSEEDKSFPKWSALYMYMYMYMYIISTVLYMYMYSRNQCHSKSHLLYLPCQL